jgi:hypothetical protein
MTAAEEAAIRSNMQQVVQSGMGNNVYVSGNVNQVVFVGTRAVDGNITSAPVAVGNANELESGGNANNGLSGPGRGILGAFGALFLFLLLLVFIRRRRKDEVADEQVAEPVKVLYVWERDLAAFGHHDSGDNVIPFGSLADKDTLALADTMALALEAPQPKKLHGVKTLSSNISKQKQSNPSIARAGTKHGGAKPIAVSAPVLTMSDVPDEDRGEQGVYDRFDGDIIQCLDAIAEDDSEDGLVLLQEDDLGGDEDGRIE